LESSTPDAPHTSPGGLPPGALDEAGRPRILILRLSALGDVVHGLPVLHALRKAFPDSEIGWAVDDRSSALLEGHPEITRLHVVPRSRWRELSWWRRWREFRAFRRELRSFGYTVAVDLQSLTKSSYLAKSSRARIRIGFAAPEGRELSRWFLNYQIVPSPRLKHIIEKNLSLLIPLSVRREKIEFVFPDYSDARASVLPFLQSLGGKPAVIHPGSSWPSKRWPVESFTRVAKRLVDELGMPVAVTGKGDLERSRAEAVVRGAGHGAHLAPDVGLREMAALLGEAALFVGGDTGPMQIAWGLGAPTVAVFGPTRGERNGPLAERARWIDAGLGCTGCRRRTCPDGTTACMRGVDPDAVFDLAREVLA
jgi:lipopolysaccharide heptosyltransferase I